MASGSEGYLCSLPSGVSRHPVGVHPTAGEYPDLDISKQDWHHCGARNRTALYRLCVYRHHAMGNSDGLDECPASPDQRGQGYAIQAQFPPRGAHRFRHLPDALQRDNQDRYPDCRADHSGHLPGMVLAAVPAWRPVAGADRYVDRPSYNARRHALYRHRPRPAADDAVSDVRYAGCLSHA